MPSEVTKDRLYAVAAQLFAEHGYDSTSVRMVADALGIKAGSLYYHIRSKEDLLFEVIDRALTKLIDSVQDVMQSDASPGEKLERALSIHLRVGAETRNEMIVTAREVDKLGPELESLIKTKRRRYERMFQELIEAGMENGELRRYNGKLATFALIGMINWIAQLFQPTGELSLEEVCDICIGIAMKGLKAETRGVD